MNKLRVAMGVGGILWLTALAAGSTVPGGGVYRSQEGESILPADRGVPGREKVTADGKLGGQVERRRLLGPPTGLEVLEAFEDTIDLTWVDESTTEVLFHIQINTDGLNWADHGTAGADEEYYAADGLAAWRRAARNARHPK